MGFVADSLLTDDEIEQVYVLSVMTAADFTVSVPVWLLELDSYDPDDGTKLLSPSLKPDHSIVICSVMSVILHEITVSVFSRTSLLIASTAENRGNHF